MLSYREYARIICSFFCYFSTYTSHTMRDFICQAVGQDRSVAKNPVQGQPLRILGHFSNQFKLKAVIIQTNIISRQNTCSYSPYAYCHNRHNVFSLYHGYLYLSRNTEIAYMHAFIFSLSVYKWDRQYLQDIGVYPPVYMRHNRARTRSSLPSTNYINSTHYINSTATTYSTATTHSTGHDLLPTILIVLTLYTVLIMTYH